VSGLYFPIKSISTFEKAFKRAVKRAALTDFHMHDLRHCRATEHRFDLDQKYLFFLVYDERKKYEEFF